MIESYSTPTEWQLKPLVLPDLPDTIAVFREPLTLGRWEGFTLGR